MDRERQMLEGLKGMGNVISLLSDLTMEKQWEPIGTPLNPFADGDPFSDDAEPKPVMTWEEYELAVRENDKLRDKLEELKKEHYELLSVIAPLKDFSEEVLASYGAWCSESSLDANNSFVKAVGGASEVAGFYVRLGEVVDRINEWCNGR